MFSQSAETTVPPLRLVRTDVLSRNGRLMGHPNADCSLCSEIEYSNRFYETLFRILIFFLHIPSKYFTSKGNKLDGGKYNRTQKNDLLWMTNFLRKKARENLDSLTRSYCYDTRTYDSFDYHPVMNSFLKGIFRHRNHQSCCYSFLPHILPVCLYSTMTCRFFRLVFKCAAIWINKTRSHTNCSSPYEIFYGVKMPKLNCFCCDGISSQFLCQAHFLQTCASRRVSFKNKNGNSQKRMKEEKQAIGSVNKELNDLLKHTKRGVVSFLIVMLKKEIPLMKHIRRNIYEMVGVTVSKRNEKYLTMLKKKKINSHSYISDERKFNRMTYIINNENRAKKITRISRSLILSEKLFREKGLVGHHFIDMSDYFGPKGWR